MFFAIARSAYLRLRPGSAYLRLRWLIENQHSAAFSPLGVRWSTFDSTPWYFWGRHSTLENIENIPQIIILFKNRNVVLFICFAIARSAYLRLRPGSAYLRLRWLVENQHSAAFSPLGVRWSAFDSTPWYFWGRHLILFPIGIPGVGV